MVAETSQRQTEPRLPRSLHLALFAIGLLWLLAARVGAESASLGIARALHAEIMRPLLRELFLFVLLLTGYTALNWVGLRNGSVRSSNALPFRPSAAREWQKGTALGWAMLLVAVLPAALVGDLHPQFWWAPRAWGLALLSTLTVLIGALAAEVAFRGFLLQRLIAAIGPSLATVVLSGVYALVATSGLNTTSFSFLVMLLLGFLFTSAYLRTHALWVGWGLHFGWLLGMCVLLGLPVAGSAEPTGLVATNVSGSLWLTGGAYGPEGSLITVLVVLAALVAVYSLTREYAWAYTHAPIVPAGYPMHVAPPAAHTAMESAPAPLVQIVQIAGATPRSTVDMVKEPAPPQDPGANG